mmetsp:Transcript_17060/g.59809  ORF Transcript_17060/g.59809 Transcript_17060/m.59809 type:complete len:790 (-) Transcript_17060:448-2817(-)|eukprot:CAMPEP_0203809524 /NCGR_PEP_ID=MMETSP0115-20131106/2335_1 /ASSEMBLY_ACC=CAM_ASM_000227 /TAXON_ID=33651 /ORGANISM="Bicosoecid sp, Strain ms1" /LENGTH=789 /DNA_ID=CAMNT_0050718259 /DNA_START=175 /DNA_END=2544 /DNA_ORIENTATION=-
MAAAALDVTVDSHATDRVEAAVLSEAAMASGNPDELRRALSMHRYLEYPVPAELYEGGEDDAMCRAGRYMPSHVPYRCPPLSRLAARRQCRLAIVVTMYNESGSQLLRTMEGVAQNVTNFARDSLAGKATGLRWQDIVVVVVADGIEKIDADCTKAAERLGMVSLDAMYTAARGTTMHLADDDTDAFVQLVEADTVQLHTFEFAPQLRPSTPKLQKRFGARYSPVQTVFVIKQHNRGKLDSHKVFFDAFCETLQPEFVCLLDVGTQPDARALVNVVSSMRRNPSIGGCSGEIAVGVVESDDGSGGGDLLSLYLNLVTAAQVFEYKVSHCMDKALESWCGFLTVLPGAFSAYRYRALVGDGDEPLGVEGGGAYRRPLDKYFASLHDPHQRGRAVAEHDVFDANMYLAEDRILCFEIVASKAKAYTLHYTTGAVAYTDVPADLASLLKQRRRWLNGSFFAMLYALRHFGRIFTDTRHAAWRKCVLAVELVYFCINVVVTWFILGSLYLTFKLVLLYTFTTPFELALEYGLTAVYLIVTGAVFVLSLGNDAVASRQWFRWCAVAYTGLMLIMTVVAVASIASTAPSTAVVVGSVALIAAYAASSLLHGQLQYTAATFLQYYLMLPVFINIFTIFSFCNIHDVSWGTKGLEGGAGAARKLVGAASARRVDDGEAARLNVEQRAAAELEKRRVSEAAAKERQRDASFKAYRTTIVLLMMGSNWLYISLVSKYVIDDAAATSGFVAILGTLVLVLLGVRVLGSMLYQAERVVKASCGRCGCSARRRELDIAAPEV